MECQTISSLSTCYVSYVFWALKLPLGCYLTLDGGCGKWDLIRMCGGSVTRGRRQTIQADAAGGDNSRAATTWGWWLTKKIRYLALPNARSGASVSFQSILVGLVSLCGEVVREIVQRKQERQIGRHSAKSSLVTASIVEAAEWGIHCRGSQMQTIDTVYTKTTGSPYAYNTF